MLELAPLVVDTATNDVEQLARDGLLATLVVLQIELAQNLVGIVRSGLHGNHTCGVIAGDTVKQCRVHHQVLVLRDELREHGVHVLFYEEVVVQRNCLLVFTRPLLLLALDVLLRLLCNDV